MVNIFDNIEALCADYERDGVIRIRSLFSPQRVQEIRHALQRYVDQLAASLPESDVVYEADGQSVRNLWRMEQHDPFFRELATEPALIQLLTPLLHGEPVLMAVETFNKPAKVGSGIPSHQDNAYFCQTPPDVLTVWIAMDPATQANGPVYYLRGSHKQGPLPHKHSGVTGNSMGLDASFDNSDPFVGTLDAGDALVHHCQTIHYSSRNETDHPRCGLLMVFRGQHTQTDSQLKAFYSKPQSEQV